MVNIAVRLLGYKHHVKRINHTCHILLRIGLSDCIYHSDNSDVSVNWDQGRGNNGNIMGIMACTANALP